MRCGGSLAVGFGRKADRQVTNMDSIYDTDLLGGGGMLKDALQNLSTRFFTLEEFPFLDRGFLPCGILAEALQRDRSDLNHYALGLNGKQLEGLLFDLKEAKEQEEIQRAVQILKVRVSSRLIRLLTILYQYNDSSRGLNEGLREICVMLTQSGARVPEDAFIRRFGDVDDKVKAVKEAIEEMRWNITECLKVYAIHEKSAFAVKCVLSYLNTANRAGLLLNRFWILRTLENLPAAELKKLIENYLKTYKLTEYHDGINLEILHKLGRPYDSPDWEAYPAELKKKFSEWCFLHQLKLHTMKVPKKYSILSKYVDRVKTSYTVKDENLLVIDFGEIVIADIYDRPYSFFYQKEIYEQEMAAWQADEENLPTFIRIDKMNPTARDFIIVEAEEPCVKLSYEGIDILYIQEMLDIKMGIEPDIRRKGINTRTIGNHQLKHR